METLFGYPVEYHDGELAHVDGIQLGDFTHYLQRVITTADGHRFIIPLGYTHVRLVNLEGLTFQAGRMMIGEDGPYWDWVDLQEEQTEG